MDFKKIFTPEFYTPELLKKIFISVFVIVFLISVYFIVKKILKKTLYTKLKQNTVFLINKFLKYSLILILLVYVLSLFNVKLTAIFGAAGIAGIAIGFAAQTSISNIISGFFLLSEQAFKVGDYISVGDDSGTVDSVDMLCVRIHTSDNQFIRIPNELIIKTNLKNNSYFAKRRYSMSLTIPYDADLKAAVKVLETVPEQCDLSLKDPAPQVLAEEFSDFGVKITLNAWTESCNYLEFRNQIILATKENFDKNNIKIASKNFLISK